jgi:hypothetical protein
VITEIAVCVARAYREGDTGTCTDCKSKRGRLRGCRIVSGGDKQCCNVSNRTIKDEDSSLLREALGPH